MVEVEQVLVVMAAQVEEQVGEAPMVEHLLLVKVMQVDFLVVVQTVAEVAAVLAPQVVTVL
jgi:hypothetical protein